MASKNGNDNGNNPEAIICETLTVIKNEKNAADSSEAAGRTLQESKEKAQGYKICCLDSAEKSHKVYQDIMSCVTLGNYKKTEIIQGNTEEYIKKDEDIEKLIKESSKLLNEMRVKMEEAHNAACAMSNCVKNKLFPKSGKPSKDGKIGEIEHDLKEIMDKTKTLDEKGQNAFESAVTIAGIQTFTNTHSLKEFVKLLVDAVKIFKDCVDANIKSTAEDVSKAREELNAVVEELAQIMCDTASESTTSQGLECIIKFICESECDGECLDLCEEYGSCYDKGKENEGRKKTPRRKGKQSADQY
ncbi:hypothetical protein GWK08_01240 [Leptobacterium flavescens]|uniref:Uncharacterized protein n=1 Tax=Leptobacterium flavescens TaxID=472055 RepID=A0A6P0UHE5_9FLAO|nr:hypothetical protein [Leptobacterium flavescens]NER12052.1 hypothetical protein [Leptobacterium flavescens]